MKVEQTKYPRINGKALSKWQRDWFDHTIREIETQVRFDNETFGFGLKEIPIRILTHNIATILLPTSDAKK